MCQQKSYAKYSAIALTLAIAMTANGQTREFLDAPVMRSSIPVRWDSAGKALQWLDRDANPTTFGSNDLFLSKGPISVTYPRMNPLKLRGSASSAAVDDPSVATMQKLIDALTTVVTTVVPPPPAAAASVAPTPQALRMFLSQPLDAPAPCGDPRSSATNLLQLWGLLYGQDPAVTLTTQIQVWIRQIDDGLRDGSGFEAVQHAADQIGRDAQGVGNKIKAIQGILDQIHTCAQSDKSTDQDVYLAADLALGHNNTALQQLTELKKTMTDLQTELNKTYVVAARWVGPDQKEFRMNTDDIKPTLEKMQNVTVKLVSVNFDVDAATGALTIGTPQTTTVTFRVRRYSFLTPEIGAGAVFGTITKPNYGTGKNAAGQTVVAKTDNSSLSINPSLMVNFVCHCSAGPLAPMAQIGTSISKDLPGVLLGGGLRLFGLGKGDISLSGGVMFAWVKDLQKLKPGDVVTGTADINADLGYTSKPKTGKYFAILYKF